MALLEVKNLVLHYATGGGLVRAVDSVSFQITGPGEALGIIGESGSGKTSMVSALIRMLPPNVARFEGELVFDGVDLMSLSDEAYRREIRWKKIAVVFQGAMNSFNPVIKVGLQVAERLIEGGGMNKKDAFAQSAELLEMVGLRKEIFHRYPHELSGGMKQRAAVAMALAMKPSLLILDEPTSALDVSVQAQVMNLLKTLKWELGVSMIFITHDIALASDISDRIAVVQNGRVCELGPAEDVLRRPQHAYTRKLLASVPALDVQADALQDVAAVATGTGAAAPGVDGGPAPAARPAATVAPETIQLGTVIRPAAPAESGPAHRAKHGTAFRSAPSGRPLVAVEALRVHFPVRRGVFQRALVKAVDGVSLSLERGETVAVVGESGSGKTTLGRATLGLVRPTLGSVSFDGRPIAGLSREEQKRFRRRAQVVFQDPYASMSPFMTVREIVEEPLVVHGIGRTKAERAEMVHRALTQVNLTPPEEIAAKYPHNLSGGQRQRVSIARALVLGPEYIVADEPVSMIDASSRTEILALMRGLQSEQGIAFLYITHDIASALHFADRIAVMYLGVLVEVGPAADVIKRPLHPYTKALLTTVPQPDPENRKRLRPVIPGEPPSPADAPPGCPFAGRCPEAIKGKCDAVRPAPFAVEPGREVACHLFER